MLSGSGRGKEALQVNGEGAALTSSAADTKELTTLSNGR